MNEFSVLRSPALGNDELNELFGSVWPSHTWRDFQPVLARSFTYLAAYHGLHLVGFLNVAWDGGVHGFILDTTVHKESQRKGLGVRLLREPEQIARAHGLEWLHVDFEPELESFYRAAGYAGTRAGLLRLR